MRANRNPAALDIKPSYAPLVLACARHGIGRTTAFKLASEGLLATVRIGARTFVMLDSLESLPQRLLQATPATPPISRPQA